LRAGVETTQIAADMSNTSLQMAGRERDYRAESRVVSLFIRP